MYKFDYLSIQGIVYMYSHWKLENSSEHLYLQIADIIINDIEKGRLKPNTRLPSQRKLCEIALHVRPGFIKTSTGFGTGGATIEDVKLMKECVGDKIQIKAAGGIRCAEDALTFIEAGATRIGTSAGVEIIEQFKNMKRGE